MMKKLLKHVINLMVRKNNYEWIFVANQKYKVVFASFFK